MRHQNHNLSRLLARLHEPVTDANEAAAEEAAIALGQLGAEALPAIGDLIASPDVDRRFWGVRALWANGSPAAQEALIACLSDADELIRSVAALELGELWAEGAIGALSRLLREDASVAGQHAADALAKIGLPAADALIAALNDARAWVRLRAARALVPIESKAAIRPLIHLLDNDESYLVRHYADEALKRMGVGQMIYFR